MMPTKDEIESHHYKREFGGAIGTFLITLLLPLVPFLLWTSLKEFDGVLMVATLYDVRLWPGFFADHFMPTPRALMLYAGWWAFQAVLYLFLPGFMFKARPTQDKVWKEGKSDERLEYKMNGLFSYFITFALWWGLDVVGVLPMTVWAKEVLPLFVVAQVWSTVLSLYLWWRAPHNHEDNAYYTESFVYDFFMGLELNPRSLSNRWDWKYFCECRPGLTFWVLINMSMAALQLETDGALSWEMLIVNVFHFVYILDCFVFEPALANTLDIYHDRFGHMLSFGDLVWVPFTYTFQAGWLLHHKPGLPWWALILICLLNVAGLIIFRGTNWQKHLYRMYPDIYGKRKSDFWRAIKTSKGPLLVGGFWGVAQHFNYTGDLMMGTAWCLIAGFDRLLPYFYIIYFTILLVHRRWRDEVRCRAKYGRDWDKYTKLVPYKWVPYVW